METAAIRALTVVDVAGFRSIARSRGRRPVSELAESQAESIAVEVFPGEAHTRQLGCGPIGPHPFLLSR